MPLLLHVIGVVLQFLLSCPLTLAGNGKANFSMGLGPSVMPYLVGDLPDVQYKLPLSWAGQVHVPNNKTSKLFFWLFEAETQSNNLISQYFTVICYQQTPSE